MFRWRNEKIKAVFRLQFQATQVTDSGSWLTISVLPADVGQPTARLGKALVQDGACKWENPIYETVKLIREPRTGKVQDKIYHFVMATGSPRKGLIGDVSINLADYAESMSPVSVSLPVKGSSSSAVLHVSIQNVQAAEDRRDTHENLKPTVKQGSRTLHSQLYDLTLDGSEHPRSTEDDINTRNVGLGNPMEPPRLDNIILKGQIVDHGSAYFQSPPGQSLEPQRRLPEAPIEKRHAAKQTQREEPLLQGQHHIKHTRLKEICRRESEHAPSDTTVEELKRQIFTLKREGEVTDLELESLRRQVAKETRWAKELARKVSSLTEERNALKRECETLQMCHNSVNDSENENVKDDGEVILLREQITRLRDEIECYMKEKKQLDKRIAQLNVDCEISEQKCNDLRSKFEQNQELLTKKENECARYLEILEDQEAEIARLERLIRKQEDKNSEAIETVDTLESQVRSLQQELEEQAYEFEADRREVAQAKVEQEYKALKMEEKLKQKKLDSAAAANQLQKEFGRLSEELVSKLNENEKLTVKAQREASDLRLQITVMGEDLQKAKGELVSIKDGYDIKEQKLSHQVIAQKKESDQLLLKLQEECSNLQSTKQNTEEKCELMLKENQTLRLELEILSEKNNYLSEQLEQTKNLRSQMEQMKTSTDAMSKKVETTNKERDNLDRKYALMRTEAQQSEEKLNSMRALQHEKEATVERLQSELEALRQEANSKEKVIPGKAARSNGMCTEYGNKGEERSKAVDKTEQQQLLDSCTMLQNGRSRTPSKSCRRETCNCIEKNKKAHNSQITNQGDLLSEITMLKEQSKSMEEELKEMQNKYSDMSLRFAEVEGERQQLVMTIRNLRK